MSVYFFKAQGFYKIGYSADPQKRLREIQTGSGVAISIVTVVDGTMNNERSLHALLKHYNSRGEWFHKCAALDRVIDAARLSGIGAAIIQAGQEQLLAAHQMVLDEERSVRKKEKDAKAMQLLLDRDKERWKEQVVDGFISRLAPDGTSPGSRMVRALEFAVRCGLEMIRTAKRNSVLPESVMDLYSDNLQSWLLAACDLSAWNLSRWKIHDRMMFAFSMTLHFGYKILDGEVVIKGRTLAPPLGSPPLEYLAPVKLEFLQ